MSLFKVGYQFASGLTSIKLYYWVVVKTLDGIVGPDEVVGIILLHLIQSC